MADLLKFTKMIAKRINYYDAIVEFTDETHWFNPFYNGREVIVIWSEKDEDAANY